MRRLALFVFLGSAGTATRPLRPLEPGAFAAGVSSPGAWIHNGGTTFPIGTLVLDGRYGLDDGRELHLALHPTELVTGVLSLDLGGVGYRRAEDGAVPGLTLTGDLSV